MNLSSDQIADFVDHARALDVQEGISDPDEGSNAVDDGMVDVLEADDDNLGEADLRSFVESLNEEAKAELVALAWVGRGDFDAEEWKDAVAEARGRSSEGSTSEYLIGIPDIGDLVAEGYAVIGGDSGR